MLILISLGMAISKNAGEGGPAHYEGVRMRVYIKPQPWYTLNGRLGGTQNSSGHFGIETIPWSYSP